MELRPNDNNNLSLTRFESMLKTNHVLFFDSEEFENIIHHYLNHGKIALAKKAIKLGLLQHPTSTNLKLFKVEIFVFENDLEKADMLINELYALEPLNEEIYIHFPENSPAQRTSGVLDPQQQSLQSLLFLCS